jgi:hypothetical protein
VRKRCPIYVYTLKKRLVWVFYNRGDRDKANETDLKEGGGMEMSTTVLSIYATALSFSFLNKYLPTADVVNCVSGKQSNKNAVL